MEPWQRPFEWARKGEGDTGRGGKGDVGSGKGGGAEKVFDGAGGILSEGAYFVQVAF